MNSVFTTEVGEKSCSIDNWSLFSGIVAIVGDLFEREEDIDDPALWREAGSEDEHRQIINRWKILEQAHALVPGAEVAQVDVGCNSCRTIIILLLCLSRARCHVPDHRSSPPLDKKCL